ncbi:MAG TPA: DNA/RNA nuclease SfsA [Myxococcota bacterium]
MLLVPFDKPVVSGRLLRRYQRFFVDVVLDDSGARITAHTANTGAMTGLVDDNARVLLTHHTGTKRKLPYELEAVFVHGAWVSVNTGTANAFAAQAVAAGLVDELAGYSVVRREVSPSKQSHSRFDLCLEQHPVRPGPCFVEVKSVTLAHGARALFPDAVTERGKKHLDALARLAKKGRRAAMLYVNKRAGCSSFAPARAIDPVYARALKSAARAGVEILCASCAVDERGLSFAGRLAVELS